MKSFFSNLSLKKTLMGGVGVLLVGIALLLYLRNGSSKEQLLVVQPGEFVQEVSVSGTVVATDDVDLAFAESGRVEHISVRVGDKVSIGRPLVSLSQSTLRADLLAAEADLALKRAEASNTTVNINQVRKQQDTLVESAYRKLLSTSLTAVPSFNTVDATPPTITGLYSGEEGEYKILIAVKSNAVTDDFTLRTFGVEKTEPVDILENEPTPLGSRGLFISFPDNLSNYDETIWYVTIPNVKSTSYSANYNAYQEALRTRDKEISAAEAEVNRTKDETTVSEAEIARAEADVMRIQAEIAERTIRAPFAGTVTDVQAKLGGVVSANAPAVSLISDASLQIESFVPEINIPLIAVGDTAIVTLDAYGSDVPFEAKVIFIDPAETVRDGVSTYRAKLEFVKRDERIRSGMTANVTITTEKKSNVLTVPQGVVMERDGKKIVRIQEDGQIIEREVVLGSVSSVGQVEIVSGLRAGEQVVLSIP